MSETNAQEPTMEEILASIRRIISEDDPPAEAASAAVAAPAPAAAPPPPASEPAVAAAPAPEAGPPPPTHAAAYDDDVLELTDAVEPEPASSRAAPPPSPAAQPTYEETLGDLDVFSTAAAPSAPSFTPQAPSFQTEPLVGSYASETSAGHFGALARSVAMPKDARSLEDVVRELLTPLLRGWLDLHLPAIVEARVQAEVERISRRNGY